MPERDPTSSGPAGDVLAKRRADHALARRCVAGERAAQLALFRAHSRRVHHILYRILGNNDEMDDLIQDAFIEIFGSLPGYRGDAHLGTWVDRITTRLAFRYVKNRKPRAEKLPTLHLVTDASAGADAAVAARETLRRVYALMEKLEAGQQIAFTLHVLDDRSLKEVASLSGASLVATKVRVWRARRALRALASRDPELAHLVEGLEE